MVWTTDNISLGNVNGLAQWPHTTRHRVTESPTEYICMAACCALASADGGSVPPPSNIPSRSGATTRGALTGGASLASILGVARLSAHRPLSFLRRRPRSALATTTRIGGGSLSPPVPPDPERHSAPRFAHLLPHRSFRVLRPPRVARRRDGEGGRGAGGKGGAPFLLLSCPPRSALSLLPRPRRRVVLRAPILALDPLRRDEAAKEQGQGGGERATKTTTTMGGGGGGRAPCPAAHQGTPAGRAGSPSPPLVVDMRSSTCGRCRGRGLLPRPTPPRAAGGADEAAGCGRARCDGRGRGMRPE